MRVGVRSRRSFSDSLLSSVLVALTLGAPASAMAEVSVAVAPVTGPKKTGAAKIAKVVRSKLAQSGLQVLSDRTLQVAAKKIGMPPATPNAAEEAGADLLVLVTTKKTGKKFIATGRLIDVGSGRILKTAESAYKKGGAANAGAAIGSELAEVASAFKPTAVSPAQTGRSPADTSKKSRVLAAKDEDEADVSAAKRAAPAVVPKDELGGPTATVRHEAAESDFGESKVLRLSLGLTSQLATAYTVTVASQSTGLAYKLNPLFGVSAGGRLAIPSAGLSLDLALSYVRVTYTVDIMPPVTPLKPSGRYLDFDAVLAYEVTLSRFGAKEERRLYAAPLLGLVYRSLSVEKTVPQTIVISSGALSPRIGGRFGLALGSVALEATGAADLVVNYSEEPDKTGNNGTGLALDFSLAARYWISSSFGLGFNVGYDWMRVSLSGEGTRRRFANDPMLVNATVFTGDARASFGALLAL